MDDNRNFYCNSAFCDSYRVVNMGKVKVKNLSCLTESAALMRCALFLTGNEYDSQRDSDGNQDVKIRLVQTKEGTYSFTVTDFK